MAHPTPPLDLHLRTGTSRVKQGACRALQNLARLPENRRDILDAGAVPLLLTAVSSHDLDSMGSAGLCKAAVRCLFNLCLCGAACRDVVDAGGVAVLLSAARRAALDDKSARALYRLIKRLGLYSEEAHRQIGHELALMGVGI